MTRLQIPETLTHELELAAEGSGRTKEQLAVEILDAHFADKALSLSELTEAQLPRLKESIDQIKRGEFIPAEQVNAFFEDWFNDLEAR